MILSFPVPISGNLIIPLDASRLSLVGGICKLNISSLDIPVINKYPLPVPYARIITPSTYSTQCATSNLPVGVSSQSINSDCIYS